MEAFLIVNDFQEVADALFGFLEVAVFVNMDFLLFEGFEEAFHPGVIVRIAFSAHAEAETSFFQSFDILIAGILDPTV